MVLRACYRRWRLQKVRAARRGHTAKAAEIRRGVWVGRACKMRELVGEDLEHGCGLWLVGNRGRQWIDGLDQAGGEVVGSGWIPRKMVAAEWEGWDKLPKV